MRHHDRGPATNELVQSLVDELETDGQYYALYCSLESVQAFGEPQEGIPAIVRSIQSSVRYHPHIKSYGFAEDENFEDINNVLKNGFASLIAVLDRPLVVLFAEADCLSNGTLITFLCQLRDGYVNRSRTPFLYSLKI